MPVQLAVPMSFVGDVLSVTDVEVAQVTVREMSQISNPKYVLEGRTDCDKTCSPKSRCTALRTKCTGRKVGGVLFSHFLDGSSGVMYTSFLGLIIDEVVNWIDEYE